MSILHFEQKNQPLLPTGPFYNRLLVNVLVGFAVLVIFLFIGIWGYEITCQLPFMRALLNASMILSGMGPCDIPQTDAGRLFASIYALFSGVIFISTVGIIMAPVVHRVFHRFHLQVEDDMEKENG